jgi:hypothetical protein
MAPTDVDIIGQRFAETTWSGQPLVREETYKMSDGSASHWFYLPKDQDWAVINGEQPMSDRDCRLADFIQYRAAGGDQVHLVGVSNGQLVTPDEQVLINHRGIAEGEVQVFSMKDLEDSQSLEDASPNE